MLNEPYLTKEVKSEYSTKDYKSADYRIAIHPEGHQFVLSEGQADELLKLHGYRNATEAKKAGWRFIK